MNNEDAGTGSAEQPEIAEEKDLKAKTSIENETAEKVETGLTSFAVEEAPAELQPKVTTTADEAATENAEDETTMTENVSVKGGDAPEALKGDVPEAVDAEADEQAKKLESPIFKELAAPTLPALAPENRARLQMQSPNRIFFYWSIKNNPYRTLHKALGDQAQNYRLVAKLVNLRNDKEEIYPVEPEGSWWFNVEAGGNYRVEIGFYAANRPFVRLVFSNTVETPRTAPSPNLDRSPTFAVSADEFAEALDASGYRQDAFDIVLAGNDEASADEATNAAFEQIAGNVFDPAKFAAAELRYVLYALAAGAALEDLRAEMTPLLFDYLVNILEQQPDALDAENVLPVWESNFGTEHTTEMRARRLSATVFGASLINFPHISGRKEPKLKPFSSLR